MLVYTVFYRKYRQYRLPKMFEKKNCTHAFQIKINDHLRRSIFVLEGSFAPMIDIIESTARRIDNR